MTKADTMIVQPSQNSPTLPLILPLNESMRREVFGLDEGDVTLIFPDKLSAASFEDLVAHLKIFLKKAKRRAGVKDGEDSDADILA